MKLCALTISFLFFTLITSGQSNKDTIIAINYIDSLKRELSDLKSRNNFLYWAFQEKANVCKIDTVFIRSDSSIISYLLKNERPLKRQFNILDKENNVVQYAIHYYDSKGRASYIENWDTLNDHYFDAKLSSAERIKYDSADRQTLSVKYLQSARRTIRTEYYYNSKGEKQTNIKIIKSDALWDE